MGICWKQIDVSETQGKSSLMTLSCKINSWSLGRTYYFKTAVLSEEKMWIYSKAAFLFQVKCDVRNNEGYQNFQKWDTEFCEKAQIRVFF